MLLKRSAFGLNGIQNKFKSILNKPVAPKTNLVSGATAKPKTGLQPGMPKGLQQPKVNYASDSNLQKIYSGQAYGIN